MFYTVGYIYVRQTGTPYSSSSSKGSWQNTFLFYAVQYNIQHHYTECLECLE